MLRWIVDLHQTLSANAGYKAGRNSVPFKCPWWADDGIYGLAYLQGKGVDIPKPPPPVQPLKG